MIQFISHNMAPLMFGGLVVGMIMGYPAAFSIGAVGLFFGLIGIELGLISPIFLGNLTFQMFSVISNDLLLAIPFFTLMGPFSNDAGWRRTCSRVSASCSAACAAACPMR